MTSICLFSNEVKVQNVPFFSLHATDTDYRPTHKAFKQFKQFNLIHSHSIAELINILLIQQENFLSYDVNADCIRLKIGQNEEGSSDSNLTTSWHCVDFSALSPEDLRDEASLGFLMATNAWHLSGQAPGDVSS